MIAGRIDKLIWIKSDAVSLQKTFNSKYGVALILLSLHAVDSLVDFFIGNDCLFADSNVMPIYAYRSVAVLQH